MPTLLRTRADRRFRLTLMPRFSARLPAPTVRPRHAVLVAALSLVIGISLPLIVHNTAALIASLAVVCVALFVSVSIAVLRGSLRRNPEARTELLLDPAGVSIVRDCTVRMLVSFASGFGISIFTSARRDRIAIGITTPQQALCIGGFIGASPKRFQTVLPKAVTLPTDDLRLACMLPDGEPLEVDAASLRKLISELQRIDPRAFERCYLTDARGTAIALDGTCVRAGLRTFDLSAPFEWSVSRFRDHAGVADTCFEATWLRQAHDEVAFVSLVRGDERTSLHDVLAASSSRGDPYLARDARLANAQLGPPPPSASCLAVDRLFMLPIRRVLDCAALPNRRPAPGDDAPAP